MKYRKTPVIPVIVEAVQFNGDREFIENYFPGLKLLLVFGGRAALNTVYGRIPLHIGDYIVMSEPGLFYPVQMKDFENEYEPIEEWISAGEIIK